MTFTLESWMIYTLWGVFGFMLIDFLIAFFKSFWQGSFGPTIVLGYLKDVLYYVLPLNVLLSMVSFDPTYYTIIVFYFIGGLAIMAKYVLDVIRRFQ
ncbi:hypothetical protein [Paenibacillus roseipurpureus]|uniref:Uncharacterized protein n=1 Tax=Paenibacillus roseopurpureus TaxID=2918901 RepID=A0AA96RKD1_9BACL|nr:hypothetical protein [Paenibacillus sp. MBLB1832]WNR46218.1 hypothetical protein MJB10_09035 [Paenibacillus sp. MBLB1832]